MPCLQKHVASCIAQCLSLGVIPRVIILPPIPVSVLSLEVVAAHFCCPSLPVNYCHLAYQTQGRGFFIIVIFLYECKFFHVIREVKILKLVLNLNFLGVVFVTKQRAL